MDTLPLYSPVRFKDVVFDFDIDLDFVVDVDIPRFSFRFCFHVGIELDFGLM